MATMQNVLDLARIPLNDADKTRYPDGVLLTYAIHGLQRLYRFRRDLFFGIGQPSLSMTASSAFPLPDQFIEPLADYVVARAESVDDEHVVDERSAAFMKLFLAG